MQGFSGLPGTEHKTAGSSAPHSIRAAASPPGLQGNFSLARWQNQWIRC